MQHLAIRTSTSLSTAPSTVMPKLDETAGRFWARRVIVRSASGTTTSEVFSLPSTFDTICPTGTLPAPIAT